MQHVMFRGRLPSGRLPGNGLLHCRSYAWKTNPAFEAEAQPTVISEDGSRTLRTRQHGNRSLPLPPLMDPLAIAGKQRHKRMKALASKSEENLSDFQKKLRLNPYAHALATEIRQCRLTQARIPSHFLIPFAANIVTPEENDGSPKSALVPALRTKKQGKTYALGVHEALNPLKGKKGKWAILLNQHQRERAALALKIRTDQLTAKDWTWDDSMAETVLGQLRENVVEGLEACIKSGLSVDMSGLDNVERDDLACILTFSGDDMKGNAPVYNLCLLLSPDQAERVLQASPRLALLRHKRAVNAVLALEKLSNYVQGIEGSDPT